MVRIIEVLGLAVCLDFSMPKTFSFLPKETKNGMRDQCAHEPLDKYG